jgi:predicted transcriptional regulator
MIEEEAMSTRVLTAHVPESLAEKVDELAARTERSRGWIIKQALSAYIEEEEERRRLTMERWRMSTPAVSLTTRQYRLGLRVLVLRMRNPSRDETEMDQVGTFRRCTPL